MSHLSNTVTHNSSLPFVYPCDPHQHLSVSYTDLVVPSFVPVPSLFSLEYPSVGLYAADSYSPVRSQLDDTSWKRLSLVTFICYGLFWTLCDPMFSNPVSLLYRTDLNMSQSCVLFIGI